MLVLSRKNGQKIIINDNIEITILDCRHDGCKIAINAPREVTIYREEVYRQIQSANKASNKTSLDSIESLASLVKEEGPKLQEKVNKIIIKKKES